MKAQTIRIKCRKDGTVSVKGNGDRFSFRLETGELVEGVMKPTFGYKLRRFCRRWARDMNAALEAFTECALPEPPEQPLLAAEVPYIGLEE